MSAFKSSGYVKDDSGEGSGRATPAPPLPGARGGAVAFPVLFHRRRPPLPPQALQPEITTNRYVFEAATPSPTSQYPSSNVPDYYPKKTKKNPNKDHTTGKIL
ncbi:unnamed protein product [Fraxinus pennsylvanica]|uniref:Uncharacterized protein n=1 Tax=Fraxinus pennsylvanica TaxID=56036 RepID=A0AAD1ZP61_9LAMI|nr:unnamed protein product [Fraxinus pennsylvanica]